MGNTVKILIVLAAAAVVAYFVAQNSAPQQRKRPRSLRHRHSRFWQPQGVSGPGNAGRVFIAPIYQGVA